MAKLREFNEREFKFVQEMTKNGFNKHKSAIDAGYSKNTALVESHRIAERPHIKAYLDEVKQVLKTHRIEEAAKVLEQNVEVLQSIIRQLKPKEGEKIKHQHVKSLIEATRELNKLFGLYAPQQRETKNVTIDMTLDRIDEAKRVYKEY